MAEQIDLSATHSKLSEIEKQIHKLSRVLRIDDNRVSRNLCVCDPCDGVRQQRSAKLLTLVRHVWSHGRSEVCSSSRVCGGLGPGGRTGSSPHGENQRPSERKRREQ
ncbi:hypothetical protein Pla123a_11440 [Posidoniimonas polymericola]|uniref:Uncharacterized protein n=1 Tax=Posidoniimonas polymericola TaxID=2528002 RepID=A0A5C5YUL5_9BACT|nr:hypothetical protein Pla123a_11440 [Posidoniimonas polymericola]